jgi:hypothetical protein
MVLFWGWCGLRNEMILASLFLRAAAIASALRLAAVNPSPRGTHKHRLYVLIPQLVDNKVQANSHQQLSIPFFHRFESLPPPPDKSS